MACLTGFLAPGSDRRVHLLHLVSGATWCSVAGGHEGPVRGAAMDETRCRGLLTPQAGDGGQ